MTLTERNGVSIAFIIIYLPILAAAVFLCVRHGIGKSAGWRFLVVFALAKVLAACFDLATISQPTNVSLYIGYFTLINVALSPLELTSIGLLSRLNASVLKHQRTSVPPRALQLCGLVVTVALILSIVGGTEANQQTLSSGNATSYTKVAMVLYIVGFVAICGAALLLSPAVGAAEPGEKRILYAVAASLPFLLVRLVYSIVSTFGHLSSFSLVTGNETIAICMAFIEELIMVLIYLGMGLTLRKLGKDEVAAISDSVHRQRRQRRNGDKGGAVIGQSAVPMYSNGQGQQQQQQQQLLQPTYGGQQEQGYAQR